jgi:hypothetical protein
MERVKQFKVIVLQTNFFEEHLMSRTSRRDFLKSTATTACTLGLAGTALAGSLEASSIAAQPSEPGAPPAPGASLSLKKGVLLDMLPKKLSFAEKFMLANKVGFDVVQAPTTPNQQTAEEIRLAADNAGIGIDSVMNMAHWEFPLSSSDPTAVEKSLTECALHSTTQNFGARMSCCSFPQL